MNSIEENAFQGCSNIEDVYCYAETVPKTHENAFLDARIEYTTLHIPAIALDGKALGSAKSIDGSVSFSAKQGTVVVAKIGKGEREDSSGIISFIIMLSTPARRGPCGDFFIFPLYGE